jgi:hypothetical protein
MLKSILVSVTAGLQKYFVGECLEADPEVQITVHRIGLLTLKTRHLRPGEIRRVLGVIECQDVTENHTFDALVNPQLFA